MDAKYLGAIVGFVMGSAGYTLSKFWIIPIIRFKKIKRRVLKLLFHLETSLNSGIPKEDVDIEIRQISAALSDRYKHLHPAYRTLLLNKDVLVDEACRNLLKLANTRDAEHAIKHIVQIRHHLKK